MAVPVNTVQTFGMVGIREDLSDVITNIAPTETPMYTSCPKGKASNRTPEYQKATLAASNAQNKVVEGNDVAAQAGAQPERLQSTTQLMDKSITVSTTAQAVNTAGRANELNYQVALKGMELKRDIESRITGNFGSAAGAAPSNPANDNGVASEMAGFESWIETNADRATGGAAGGFQTASKQTTAPVDGTTARAFTETQLKNVIRKIWNEGGNPTLIMTGGSNKQTASGFSGIATQEQQYEGRSRQRAVIMGAADVYVSDFGFHTIVPNRFQRDRTALLSTPSTWELKFLQPFRTRPLSVTGHSDKRFIAVELTLCSLEEKANGVVADLTTTA